MTFDFRLYKKVRFNLPCDQYLNSFNAEIELGSISKKMQEVAKENKIELLPHAFPSIVISNYKIVGFAFWVERTAQELLEYDQELQKKQETRNKRIATRKKSELKRKATIRRKQEEELQKLAKLLGKKVK